MYPPDVLEHALVQTLYKTMTPLHVSIMNGTKVKSHVVRISTGNRRAIFFPTTQSNNKRFVLVVVG